MQTPARVTLPPVQEIPIAIPLALIAALVGVGFRVVSFMHSRDEVRIANACFLLSTLIAGGMVFMWGVKTTQGWPVRLLVCALSFGLFGWLGVEAVRYVGRQSEVRVKPAQAAPEATPTPTERPHITARLVIDSVTRQDVNYRLQIENIDNLGVKNIRVSYGTLEFTDLERMPGMPRLLPRGGKIAIPGIPHVLKPRKHTSLVAQVFYVAEIGGKDKGFWSRFRYILQPQDFKPQTIEPESWEEGEGGDEDIKRAQATGLTKGLTLPEGAMPIVLSEVRNDGEPNVINVVNERRTFIFDPVSRRVSFKTKTNSGRLVNLELPLPESNNRMHVIYLEWHDSKGAYLAVDNTEKEDMKEKEK